MRGGRAGAAAGPAGGGSGCPIPAAQDDDAADQSGNGCADDRYGDGCGQRTHPPPAPPRRPPAAGGVASRTMRGEAMIRAVTFDCWGTLFLDSPAADEGYKRQRLAGMGAVLAAWGLAVAPRDLERGYAEACRRLARIWETGRDVGV